MNVEPFSISIEKTQLDDLQQRLANTCWPDEILDSAWDYGTNLAYMKDLVSYWQTSFDWRKREQELNTFPHFRVTIDGVGIHFIHIQGKGPRSIPLLLTNGWPSSFLELLRIIPKLTDSARFGGDPADAFDVVMPSLPGFGFSDRVNEPGMTCTKIASLWNRLMSDALGYSRFGAQGTDLGALVTSELGRTYPQQLIGIHLPLVAPALGPDTPPLSEQERAFFAGLGQWGASEGAFGQIQRTKPQTLAYGLTDSPSGLAAWIVEKFRAWSDCGGEVERRFTKEELLTNVSLYWLTQTINSSMRLYYENVHAMVTPFRSGERVEVPCAIAQFDQHLPRAPRELAERVYRIVHWTEMPRGGHFPAHEEPDLLVEDLRHFFDHCANIYLYKHLVIMRCLGITEVSTIRSRVD